MGYLSISNSLFLNVQNTLLLGFFNIDRTAVYESASVTNMIFNNLTVVNNTANYTDTNTRYASLFDMKSLLKSMSIDFYNCFFQSNLVVDGIIGLSESLQINLTLVNNTFDDNFSSGTAAILSSQTIEYSMNQFAIINNVFTNNLCAGQGAVFTLIDSQNNMTLLNNIYINNSADQGGVGYVSDATLALSEVNGTYIGNKEFIFLFILILIVDNKASSIDGGDWYLDVSVRTEDEYPLSFKNITFINSTCSQGNFFPSFLLSILR